MTPTQITLLDFAGHHPILTVFLAWTLAGLIKAPFAFAQAVYNRHLRARNIEIWGWPTGPVNADGDVVYPKASS